MVTINNLELLKQSSFGELLVDVYRNENNEVFMTMEQLARALEYSNRNSVEKIVQRNEHLKERKYSVVDRLSATDGKRYDTRIFTEKGIYEVTMLSKQPKAREFREFVQDMLSDLRKGELELIQGATSPASKIEEFEMSMIGVKHLSEMLRLSDSGKIKLAHNVFKEAGIPTKVLPNYVDEEVTESATALLKKNNVGLSAVKFNTLMIAKGLLELKSRPSSNGKTKEFKSLTKLGLEYGKNLINPHNEKETQPHYYTSKFDELIKLLNI